MLCNRIRSFAAAFHATLIVVACAPAMADITTSKSGSDLLITGDTGLDELTVFDVATDSIRIRGLSGTVVDGVVNGIVTYAGPIRHVIIDTGDGNDTVICRDLSNLSGRLDVFTRRGADDVTIRDSDLNLCRVITLGGNDDVDILNTTISRNLIAVLGGGNDHFDLVNSIVSGSARILADQGNNVTPSNAFVNCVELTNSSIASDLTVVGGNGSETVEVDFCDLSANSRFIMNPGSDSILLTNSTLIGDVTALLGNDDDRFVTDQSVLQGSLDVAGLAGNDTIAVNDSTVFGDIAVNGGNDNDEFIAVDSFIGSGPGNLLLVEGKTGDDFMFGGQTVFFSSVLLDGGPQNDSVGESGSIFNATFDTIGFEGDATGFLFRDYIAALIASIGC